METTWLKSTRTSTETWTAHHLHPESFLWVNWTVINLFACCQQTVAVSKGFNPGVVCKLLLHLNDLNMWLKVGYREEEH